MSSTTGADLACQALIDLAESQYDWRSGPPPESFITGIGEETVTVDPNHPLAGETLHFDVTIEALRDATEEEVAHGHPHGEGGHHH